MLQFFLQIETAHAGHDDIEYQTSGLANAIRCEELVSRRKSQDRKTKFLEQVREGLANGFVVINDYYYQRFLDGFFAPEGPVIVPECG